MAFLNDPPAQAQPLVFQKFPLVMYRGSDCLRVADAEQEAVAIENGFGLRPPTLPPPPEPKPLLTVEERLQALEERLEALETRVKGRKKAGE